MLSRNAEQVRMARLQRPVSATTTLAPPSRKRQDAALCVRAQCRRSQAVTWVTLGAKDAGRRAVALGREPVFVERKRHGGPRASQDCEFWQGIRR